MYICIHILVKVLVGYATAVPMLRTDVMKYIKFIQEGKRFNVQPPIDNLTLVQTKRMTSLSLFTFVLVNIIIEVSRFSCKKLVVATRVGSMLEHDDNNKNNSIF